MFWLLYMIEGQTKAGDNWVVIGISIANCGEVDLVVSYFPWTRPGVESSWMLLEPGVDNNLVFDFAPIDKSVSSFIVLSQAVRPNCFTIFSSSNFCIYVAHEDGNLV